MSGPAPASSSATSRPSDPADLGLLEAAALLRARDLSARELTEACLRRIDERNGGAPSFDGAPEAVNAWARLYPEIAREQAQAADARLDRERENAPLVCGIPLAVKDLYAVRGLPLTASSRVLEGNVAEDDSAVWRRLREQGMVLIGHTHTHEFAAGGTSDQVGNPWAPDRVAGGSSGGSAAALAARMVPAALGSDTCGSLRIPSACCGTSTVKPTHGRIPLDGVIPLASSLDHAGPMTRSLADSAALLGAMAVGEPQTTPLMPPPAPLGELPLSARPGPQPLAGLTVALTDRTAATEVEPGIHQAVDRARQECERLGARVVDLPASWIFDWEDLSIILFTDAWVYHQQHAGRRERYRIAVGEFVDAASRFTSAQAYIAAQERRAHGTAAWELWFREHGVDVVLEPTLPVTPFERGPGYDTRRPAGPGDPMIAFTSLWDMTGFPVASLPVSWDVGVSLVAPRGCEAPLIQAAIDLQEHALGVPEFPVARHESPVTHHP